MPHGCLPPYSSPCPQGSKRRVARFRRVDFTLAMAGLLWLAAGPDLEAASAPRQAPADLGAYILIGFNDLGMHCSNKDFADLAVLPPYNTFWSVLIRRGAVGQAPEVVGGPGYRVSYEFPANTYSVGKTDFWSYEDQLFGVNLPDNIGLTGNGLAGEMGWHTDHFVAEGVPLTPFDDADLVHEQPFQLALLRAYDAQDQLLATTEIVAPVSNEMTCNACHVPQPGETVEHSILRRHDSEAGTDLVHQRPVLCANCHGSNALGLPGNPELKSLSQVMHEKHAEHTDDCYTCHPGPVTQCLRDVMNTQYGMTCQDCHGDLLEVATSIEQGRRPWLDEPRCGDCHGANYAEEPNTLYRNSDNGHGGLFCATCHNSPHAILPSREERDNRQVVELQGHAGTLRDCAVCHGVTPGAPGPHGYYPTGLQDPDLKDDLRARVEVAPNPMVGRAEIRYRVIDGSPIRLLISDAAGRTVRTLTSRSQTPGDHSLVWDGRDAADRSCPAGVYFVRLETGRQVASARLVRISG